MRRRPVVVDLSTGDHSPGTTFPDRSRARIEKTSKQGQAMLGNLCAAALKRFSANPMLVEGARALTGAELECEVDRLAHALAARFAPGERAVLFMRNRIEYVLLQLAFERTGIVRVPVNRLYTAPELAAIVEHARPAAIFFDATTAERVPAGAAYRCAVDGPDWAALAATPPASTLPAVAPADLCSISFTSGTTGRPKGVMLTHANWAAVYANMLADRDFREGDCFIHIGPLTHASGAYLMPNLLRGAANVLIDMRAPDDLFAAIELHRATMFSCVPTVLTRLVNSPDRTRYDLSSLRRILYGAETMPANTMIAALECFGPVLVGNYGLTEAMMTVAFADEEDHRRPEMPGSNFIGRPYSLVGIELQDANGRAVRDGEAGEIVVKSAHVMTGYWEMPEETAAAFRDGWLRTGDLAVRHADGMLQLVGRAKDLVISGGFNIYPAEVEAWLCGLPDIREAAVFGVPDANWGERLVGIVVAHARCDICAVRDQARAVLGYKAPKELWLRDRLPKTANGKIDKRALREDVMADV